LLQIAQSYPYLIREREREMWRREMEELVAAALRVYFTETKRREYIEKKSIYFNDVKLMSLIF
jgi:hypothetical protein